MPRPGKNTLEGKRASEKWRQTMEKKYGADGVRKFLQECGRRGGTTPTDKPKGFARDHKLAIRAGAKGGRISRRKASGHGLEYEEKKETIKSLMESGHSMREISQITGMPYSSLWYYIKKRNTTDGK